MTWLQALWKATLIVVAVGVALMHSIGHACTENACHSETSVVAASITDSHAPAVSHEHDGHHADPFGSGMNPMQVCMAILTAFALAVSLCAIWRLARLVPEGHWAMRVRHAGRDVRMSLPPGGRLSFIELSVFRI